MSLKQKPENHEHPYQPSGNQPWQRKIHHLSLNPHEIPMKSPWTSWAIPSVHLHVLALGQSRQETSHECIPCAVGVHQFLLVPSGPVVAPWCQRKSWRSWSWEAVMSVVEICLVMWRDVGNWDLLILFLKGNHLYLIYRTYRGIGMLSCYSDCCLTRATSCSLSSNGVDSKIRKPKGLGALRNDQQNISPWSQMMCGSSSYPKLGRFGVFHFVWCSTPFLNHSNGAMNQTFAPPLTQLTGCFHPPWAEQQPGTSSPETTGRAPCNWFVASSEQNASASVFQPDFFATTTHKKGKVCHYWFLTEFIFDLNDLKTYWRI